MTTNNDQVQPATDAGCEDCGCVNPNHTDWECIKVLKARLHAAEKNLKQAEQRGIALTKEIHSEERDYDRSQMIWQMMCAEQSGDESGYNLYIPEERQRLIQRATATYDDFIAAMQEAPDVQ